LKLKATKYEIKAKIIEMDVATPFGGMEMENQHRDIRHFTKEYPMNGLSGISFPTHLPAKQ
jgi:hypothetical protein